MTNFDSTMPDTSNRRDMWRAMTRGFLRRCPHCGQGRLFRAFLKVVDRCESCGEEFHHHRADDAPAYFVIFIVGHAVVPIALSVELAFAPPYWLHALLWGTLSIVLAMGLLQPIKGAVVGWQWAMRMHGFDGAEAASEDLLPEPIARRTIGVER